jgi:hypothetical protein
MRVLQMAILRRTSALKIQPPKKGDISLGVVYRFDKNT